MWATYIQFCVVLAYVDDFGMPFILDTDKKQWPACSQLSLCLCPTHLSSSLAHGQYNYIRRQGWAETLAVFLGAFLAMYFRMYNYNYFVHDIHLNRAIL